jgi:hypothetical protein
VSGTFISSLDAVHISGLGSGHAGFGLLVFRPLALLRRRRSGGERRRRRGTAAATTKGRSRGQLGRRRQEEDEGDAEARRRRRLEALSATVFEGGKRQLVFIIRHGVAGFSILMLYGSVVIPPLNHGNKCRPPHNRIDEEWGFDSELYSCLFSMNFITQYSHLVCAGCVAKQAGTDFDGGIAG